MRRILAILLILALGLAGCGPQAGGESPKQHPPAGGQAPHAPGNDPNVNKPAPVQGDPGAHNTQPGYVGLFLTWESENKQTPVCEWTRNGQVQPCNNMEAPTHEGVNWIGIWEHEEPGQTGWNYTLNAQGTGAMKAITCEIAWKGQIIPGITNGKRCGVSFQLN